MIQKKPLKQKEVLNKNILPNDIKMLNKYSQRTCLL